MQSDFWMSLNVVNPYFRCIMCFQNVLHNVRHTDVQLLWKARRAVSNNPSRTTISAHDWKQRHECWCGARGEWWSYRDRVRPVVLPHLQQCSHHLPDLLSRQHPITIHIKHFEANWGGRRKGGCEGGLPNKREHELEQKLSWEQWEESSVEFLCGLCLVT